MNTEKPTATTILYTGEQHDNGLDLITYTGEHAPVVGDPYWSAGGTMPVVGAVYWDDNGTDAGLVVRFGRLDMPVDDTAELGVLLGGEGCALHETAIADIERLVAEQAEQAEQDEQDA